MLIFVGVDVAINYLRQLPALGNFPRLRLEDGLSQSARDFCAIQKGMRRTQESDDDAQARLTRYGMSEFSYAVISNFVVLNFVLQLLLWISNFGILTLICDSL